MKRQAKRGREKRRRKKKRKSNMLTTAPRSGIRAAAAKEPHILMRAMSEDGRRPPCMVLSHS